MTGAANRRAALVPLVPVVALAAGMTALAASGAAAGGTDVVGVQVRKQAGGAYRFSVTLRHADTGWKHYADRWEVLAPDGTVLGVRVLLHPHVDEQPFTRSQGGIRIPRGVDRVTIRGHAKPHGYGGKTMTVTVPR